MEAREEYKIFGYVKSNVGLRNGSNEDNFLMNGRINEDNSPLTEAGYSAKNLSEWNCFAVFDGIGGEYGGEVASRLAAGTFREQQDKLSHAGDYGEVDQIMRETFRMANNRIVEENMLTGVCGTTGTVFVTDGIVGKIYHVGDSRAYLVREGNLYLLTKDQTMAQMKVDAGFYESVDMADIREKHQLTEYIGHDHSMQYFRPTEGKWMEFRDGDRLLLCTDGFFDYCSNGQMKELLLQNRPFGETVDQFMELAFKNNSDDNITCAMIGKTKI